MASGRTMLSEEQALSFQNGDEKALGYFFNELHPALTHYANQLVKDLPLAQEIASEAFVKAWQHHTKLGTTIGIRSYLYTIVRRDSKKMANDLNLVVSDASAKEDIVDPDTPFQSMVRSETYRMIHAALQKLSPGNRKVISMYYFEGKSTGEIARELNLDPHTVKTQKARGIKALLKMLHPRKLVIIYFLENFFSRL